MEKTRLSSTSDPLFQESWELYQSSFRSEMRRSKKEQEQLIQDPTYNYDIFIHGETFIGFLLWWDFEALRYIEHFATAPLARNKGYGKSILQDFMTQTEKPILLEVELEKTTLDKRRVKFYERLGFKLNQHYYELPTFQEDEKALQLLLMTFPDFISRDDVDQFVQKYHPVVFKDLSKP